VNGLVQFAADIRRESTLEVVAIFADTGLLTADMFLSFIVSKHLQSEKDLHVIALLLNMLHFVLEEFLAIFNLFEESVFYLGVEIY
jgi:hypothetical protein